MIYLCKAKIEARVSLALTRYDKMKKCSQFSLRQRQS